MEIIKEDYPQARQIHLKSATILEQRAQTYIITGFWLKLLDRWKICWTCLKTGFMPTNQLIYLNTINLPRKVVKYLDIITSETCWLKKIWSNMSLGVWKHLSPYVSFWQCSQFQFIKIIEVAYFITPWKKRLINKRLNYWHSCLRWIYANFWLQLYLSQGF